MHRRMTISCSTLTSDRQTDGQALRAVVLSPHNHPPFRPLAKHDVVAVSFNVMPCGGPNSYPMSMPSINQSLGSGRAVGVRT